jgi:O-antigen/teichoic acid export membrane protein
MWKNTAAQSTPFVVSSVLSFVLAPILLTQLGLAAFGVWAVTGSLAQYAGLLDLGTSRAVARYVALHDAQGHRRLAQEVVTASLLIVSAMGVVAAGLAIALAPVVAGALHALTDGQMRAVLLASVTMFLAQTYARVLSGLPIGLLRMVPPNIAFVANSVINFGLSVAILYASPSLVHYAWANAAASVLGLLLMLVAVRLTWRDRILRVPARRTVRDLVGFSLKSQVDWLSTLINYQTDKVIVAVIVGVRAAAAYEIGARLAISAKVVGGLLYSAMGPTATREIARFGRAALVRFQQRYMRVAVGLAFPVFPLTALLAQPFLTAWLGTVPERAAATVAILSAAYFVNIVTGLPSVLAAADGHPGITAYGAGMGALLNVLCTVALAPLLGFYGVLGGTFVAIVAGSFLLLWRFGRAYDISLRSMLAEALAPGAVSVGLAAVGALLLRGRLGVTDRWAALLEVVLIVAGYGFLYWLVAARLGFLPARLIPRRLARHGRVAVR